MVKKINYQENLQSIKNNIIESIVNEIADSGKTQEQKKEIKADLVSKIKNNVLITTYDQSEHIVSSDSINKTMNLLYIDLITLFGVVEIVGEAIDKYNIGFNSSIDYIESKIKEINDNIESYRHTLMVANSPFYHIERFRNSESIDRNRNLFRDRFDEPIETRAAVEYSFYENTICLPLIRKDDSLHYDGTVHTGTINKHFQAGSGYTYNDIFSSLDNIIDTDMNSYWSEKILSDSPINIENSLRYKYDISNGAVCELEIIFESQNTVNEMRLNPFSEFPMKIIAIRYKETDDEKEELKEIVYPGNPDKTLDSSYITVEKSYKFKDVICKRMYILFSQEHYTRTINTYNALDMYKNKLWFENKNDRKMENRSIEFKPMYEFREDSNIQYNNLNSKIVELHKDDLAGIFLNVPNSNKTEVKYEYNYGFSNISLLNYNYDKIGVYISKNIPIKDNALRLRIYTDEDHQLDSNGNIISDIEYYIANKDNPTYADWKPILPSNIDIIESELLRMTHRAIAYLRFETKNIIAIKKNGEEMPYSPKDFIYLTNPRTGNYYAIQVSTYDYDSVYSVKYEPIEGSHVVDFSKDPITSIESFDGNNKSSFKLLNNPFIYDNNNFCMVKFIDNETGVETTEFQIENKTDIINSSFGYMNFTNDKTYQYYVHKNIVYFNKEVPSNFTVEITYTHLASFIKTKALLRRNSSRDSWQSPSLYEIKYEVEKY